ncbi:uncharacterized protein LOC131587316 [Poecile atricapillus]|uniref:uncharacterized protein LOC131587316 n=1 Tax=Poecile atricapillus TaxID=48891 RepID=UPI0027397944|nr:uncharacterized protein LOC131587316 [Poecile atricapillus]
MLVSPQKLLLRAAAEAAGLLLRTAENLGMCLSLIPLFSVFSLEFSTGAALSPHLHSPGDSAVPDRVPHCKHPLGHPALPLSLQLSPLQPLSLPHPDPTQPRAPAEHRASGSAPSSRDSGAALRPHIQPHPQALGLQFPSPAQARTSPMGHSSPRSSSRRKQQVIYCYYCQHSSFIYSVFQLQTCVCLKRQTVTWHGGWTGWTGTARSRQPRGHRILTPPGDAGRSHPPTGSVWKCLPSEKTIPCCVS